MIQTTDLRGLQPTHADLLALVPRSHVDVSAATESARQLIAAVRERGADALRDQAARFDGVRTFASGVGGSGASSLIRLGSQPAVAALATAERIDRRGQRVGIEVRPQRIDEQQFGVSRLP